MGVLALGVYFSVNIITDIKWRITKNWWHLLFFLCGLMLSIKAVSGKDFFSVLQFYLWGVLLWFLFGILLQVLRLQFAGDTKMMTITGLWLNSLLTHEHLMVNFVLFVLGWALTNFVIILLTLIRSYGVKGTLYRSKNNLLNHKRKIKIRASVPIAIGAVLSLFVQVV